MGRGLLSVDIFFADISASVSNAEGSTFWERKFGRLTCRLFYHLMSGRKKQVSSAVPGILFFVIPGQTETGP